MEAIGQLTGGVAHDFNNLLMAVLGSLELVRKRLPYDPRISPLIDNAIQGAERGATLTQRMLAFARRQELKLDPVDLQELVRGMLGFIQRTIGPAIRIETIFPKALPRVMTDPNQLETALLNLAVNARDAMEEGGVITIGGKRERISGEGALGPGEYIRLSVADTGQGMDEATLARAMEPFFTTKGVGKGTGLGLSMVHGLAVQSGGGMTMKSWPGEGTIVELWLPVAPADELAETVRTLSGGQADPASERPPLKILAVDDDALVLTNTAALLEDLGHHVLQATSGQQALECIKRHPDLDLVITDQAMPKMTGLQLREAIAADHPDMPVLIATGYAEFPQQAGEGIPRIAKPFTQEQLNAAVQAAID
jgi:CheY-like chemotaxis protein